MQRQLQGRSQQNEACLDVLAAAGADLERPWEALLLLPIGLRTNACSRVWNEAQAAQEAACHGHGQAELDQGQAALSAGLSGLVSQV